MSGVHCKDGVEVHKCPSFFNFYLFTIQCTVSWKYTVKCWGYNNLQKKKKEVLRLRAMRECSEFNLLKLESHLRIVAYFIEVDSPPQYWCVNDASSSTIILAIFLLFVWYERNASILKKKTKVLLLFSRTIFNKLTDWNQWLKLGLPN